ncbi:phosphoribosyltransferase-like protein [Halodesulfovibrio aestuarii]|uniref:phosphoribosyltransferase-like protein n=1 Tax=Halodesulfovibrio aestuarii TaxID=126333 RepID=UPI003D34216B
MKISELSTIYALLDEKGITSESFSPAAFEKMAQMLSLLDATEQDLILKLLLNFEIYGMAQYYPMFNDTLAKINFNKFHGYKKIAILPCITNADAGEEKYKSGDLVAGFFKGVDFSDYIKTNKRPHVTVYKNILTYNNPKNNDVKIFVDDFIGTGDTVITAIEDFFNHQTRVRKNYCVFSFVAMKEGLARLRAKRIPVYVCHELSKGITDSNTIRKKDDAISLMKKIEDEHLDLEPEFSLGYGQSEALVKMQRTPNNTFPIFWLEKGQGDEKWPAPFPRI